MSELARLIARTQRGFDTVVVFYKPGHADDDWVKSETWRAAQVLPASRVIIDSDGHIAARFGAFTSGQAMLYDAKGALIFQGGLTAARGHEGWSAGSDSIAAYVSRGVRPEIATTPVFGCAIRDESNDVASPSVTEAR